MTRVEKSLSIIKKKHREAAETVLNTLKYDRPFDGLLGVVAMPSGTGKTAVIAEIIQKLLSNGENSWSVLVVTNSTMYTEQYFSQLRDYLEIYCRMEKVSNNKMFADLGGKNGTVLISTAHRLINRKRNNLFNEKFLEEQIYNDASNLLIIADEVRENYFSYTYSSIRKSFPNAVFLGMTNSLRDDKRIEQRFGPLLYRYSYEEACRDGVVSDFKYQDLTGIPEYSVEITDIKSDNIISDVQIDAISRYTAKVYENRKGTLSLFLCRNYYEAVKFFESLKKHLPNVNIKIQITSYAKANIRENVYKDDYWNGDIFSGIVVACSLPAGYVEFDNVFLIGKMPEHLLFNVLSRLVRPGYDNNDYRLLVDFANGYGVISQYIPTDLILLETSYEDVPEDSGIEELIIKLSDALDRYEFDAAGDIIKQLHKKSPEIGNELENQLAFLNDAQPEVLKWKSALWCFLSEDSYCRYIPENEIIEEYSEIEEENLPTPATNIHKNSQQSGECLEKAVLEMIKEILSLDNETASRLPEYIRRQGSGIQFGFDITFSYKDKYGVDTTCMIECKNYVNNRIRQEDVTPKLVALQQTGQKVDHWILISPNGKLTNELWQMQEMWNKSQKWLPIRDVQFWTVEHGVEKLFALFPNLYAEFYSSDNTYLNETISAEDRNKIISHWKQKLAPVPILPQSWREYLHNPKMLLTQCEADISTSRQYNDLYEHYVPLRVLDKDGLPLLGTAKENFVRWLNTEKSETALLLGDFGDGKTFFTYAFSRYLTEEFLKSPETGWIPLRLTLSDFNGNRMDCRDFLDRRLREFGATLKELRDVQEQYKLLIILDGFDEMSSSMTDTAIIDNLDNLRELVEQFKGHKVIVTSRKMALYSDNIYRGVCTVLNSPQIFHLAPVTATDRVTYLSEMANTQEQRLQLAKIQSTHDLIELAAKPLFLDMMQILLDDDSDIPNDISGIYEYYAEKVLKRKFSTQLKLKKDYTHEEDIRQKFLYIMEELALCLQINNVESISLEEFKSYNNIETLADLLWSADAVAVTKNIEEDVNERLSSRSLLKYDQECPKNRRFCHRSMKEYFIARGLVRYLSENPLQCRTLLTKCSFGYEILTFAGKEICKRTETDKQKIANLLCEFAHMSYKVSKNSAHNEFAQLSTNSINLLHYSGISLPGDDWSNLLMDNVVLSGEDLSGKNFSYSSMRYANLENTDLTSCDLRYCDFTGVQFEKSGQLYSFAVDMQNNVLIAYYRDGKIRQWPVINGETVVLSEQKAVFPSNIFLCGIGKEGLFCKERVEFWNRSMHSVNFSGYIPVEKNIRVIGITDDALLVIKQNMLILFDFRDKNIVFKQRLEINTTATLLSSRLIALCDSEGLKVLDIYDGSSVVLSNETKEIKLIYAQMLSEKECAVVRVTQNNYTECYFVYFCDETNKWEFKNQPYFLGCDEEVTGISIDNAGGIYVSTLDGKITRYTLNASANLVKSNSYCLELKCKDAKIDGVIPEKTFDILKSAKE